MGTPCSAWAGAKEPYTFVQASKSATWCRTKSIVLGMNAPFGSMPCCEVTGLGRSTQRRRRSSLHGSRCLLRPHAGRRYLRLELSCVWPRRCRCSLRSRVQGRLPVALRKLLKEGEARYKWSAGASRETVISTPSTPFTVRAPQNGAGPTDSMVVSEKVTRQRWSLLPVGKKARMRSGVRSSLSFSEGVNRRPAFVRWTGSPSAAPCERIGPDSRTEQGGWDRAVQTPVPPAASHYACVHGPEPGRPRKPRES